MKRKILALLCAATMVVGASMSVCAAGSITADDVVEQVKNEKPVEVAGSSEASKPVVKGEDIVVTVKNTDKDITTEAKVPATSDALNEAAKVAEAAVSEKSANAELKPVDASNTKVITAIANEIAKEMAKSIEGNGVTHVKAETKYVVDITSSNGEAVSVKFKMPALESNQRSYVLHINDAGVVVEKIPVDVVNGVIDFKLSSFSAVAVIVETSDVEQDDNSDESSNVASNEAATKPAAPTSPKTADVFAAAALLMAAASGTASVAFGRKAKKN